MSSKASSADSIPRPSPQENGEENHKREWHASGPQLSGQNSSMDASMMMMSMLSGLANASAPITSIGSSSPAGPSSRLRDRKHGLEGPPGYMPAASSGPQHHKSTPNLQHVPASGMQPLPHPLTALFATRAQAQPQKYPQAMPTSNLLANLMHSPSYPHNAPIGRAQTPSSTTEDSHAGSKNVGTAAHRSEGTSADPDLEDASLSLLMETMDAWEEAVTKRMYSAVRDAIKAARSDVMQIVEAKFKSRAAANSTAAEMPSSQISAERTPVPQAVLESGPAHVTDANTPTQFDPNAMADMSQMRQVALSMDHKASSSAALDVYDSGQTHMAGFSQLGAITEAREQNAEDTSSGACPPTASSELQKGKEANSEQIRAQMHAYGAMFLDHLSASATSAGLGAHSAPPVQTFSTIEPIRKPDALNGSSPCLSQAANAQADMARKICEAAAGSTSHSAPPDISDISRLLQACMGPPAAVAPGEPPVGTAVSSSHDLSAPMVEAAQQLFFVERSDLQSPRGTAACGAEHAPSACTAAPLGATGTGTEELQENAIADARQDTQGPESQGETLNTKEQVTSPPTTQDQTEELDCGDQGTATDSHSSSGPGITGPESSASQPLHSNHAAQSGDCAVGAADHPSSSGSAQIHADESQPDSGIASQMDNAPEKPGSAFSCQSRCDDVSAHSLTSQDCTPATDGTSSKIPAPDPSSQIEKGEPGLDPDDRLEEPVQHRQHHTTAGAVAECHINAEDSLEFFSSNPVSFERTDVKGPSSLYHSPSPCHRIDDVDSQPLFMLASSSPSKGFIPPGSAAFSAEKNRWASPSAGLPVQWECSPTEMVSSEATEAQASIRSAGPSSGPHLADNMCSEVSTKGRLTPPGEATGAHCGVEHGGACDSQNLPPVHTFGSPVVSVQDLQDSVDDPPKHAAADGRTVTGDIVLFSESASSPKYRASLNTFQSTDTPTVSQFGRSQAQTISPTQEVLSDNCTQHSPDPLASNNASSDVEQPCAAGSTEPDHRDIEQAPKPHLYSLHDECFQAVATLTSSSPEFSLVYDNPSPSVDEQQAEDFTDTRYPLQPVETSVSSPVPALRTAEMPVDPATPHICASATDSQQDDCEPKHCQRTHSLGHKENVVQSPSRPPQPCATKCRSPELTGCKTKHIEASSALCHQEPKAPDQTKASPVTSPSCAHHCPTTIHSSPNTSGPESAAEKTPVLRQPAQHNQDRSEVRCLMQSPSSSPCRMHTHSSTQTHSRSRATHGTSDKPTSKAQPKSQNAHDHIGPGDATLMEQQQLGSTDNESSALIAACTRALDSVSSGCAGTEHIVDVSKELHALEADVLRACVLGGAGRAEVPWKAILHRNSVQESDCTGGSIHTDVADDTAEDSIGLDIDKELTCMVKDTLVAVNSTSGCAFNSQRTSHRNRQRSSSEALRDRQNIATARPESFQLHRKSSYPFHPLGSSELPPDGSWKSSGAPNPHTKPHPQAAALAQGGGLNSLQLVAAVCAAACAGSMHAANARKIKCRTTGALISGQETKASSHATGRPGVEKSSADAGPRGTNIVPKDTSWPGRPRKPLRGRFRLPEGVARATEKWLAARRPAQATTAGPIMGFGRTNSRTARSVSPQVVMIRTNSGGPSRQLRGTRSKQASPPATRQVLRDAHSADPAQDPRRIMRSRSRSGIPRCSLADAYMPGPYSGHHYQSQYRPHNQGQLQGKLGSPRAMRRSMSGHFIPTSPSSADVYNCPPHHSVPAPCKRLMHHELQHASPRSPVRQYHTQISQSQSPSRSKHTKQSRASSCAPTALSLRMVSVSPRLPLSPKYRSPSAHHSSVHGARSTSCTSRTAPPAQKRVSRGRVPTRRATCPKPVSDLQQSRNLSGNSSVRRCASVSPKLRPSMRMAPSGAGHAPNESKFVNPSLSLDWQLTPQVGHKRSVHRNTGQLAPQHHTQSAMVACNATFADASRAGSAHCRNLCHSAGKVASGGVPHELRAEFAENLRAARALMASSSDHPDYGYATPPMRAAAVAAHECVQNTRSIGFDYASGTGVMGSQGSGTLEHVSSNGCVQAPLPTGGTSVGALRAVVQRAGVGEHGHAVHKIPVHEPAAGSGVDQVSARQQLWASISAVRQDLGRLQ